MPLQLAVHIMLSFSFLADAITQHMRAHTNGMIFTLCVWNSGAQKFQTYGGNSVSESIQPK